MLIIKPGLTECHDCWCSRAVEQKISSLENRLRQFAKQMVQLEGEEDLVGARELPLGVLGENENHEQGQ